MDNQFQHQEYRIGLQRQTLNMTLSGAGGGYNDIWLSHDKNMTLSGAGGGYNDVWLSQMQH